MEWPGPYRGLDKRFSLTVMVGYVSFMESKTDTERNKNPRQLRKSWESERQSAHLYRIMTQVETDERKGRLFESLAKEAEIQAKVWAEQIKSTGKPAPSSYRPTVRVRLVGALIRHVGIRRIFPILAAMKVRGLSVYRSLPTGHAMPPSPQEESRRHRGMGSGGTLRAAVFGVNDGLVSNTSLILGVAGATNDPQIVLLSGIAGLLAGAFSMAAGEYISMRSQRELFEYQIGLEKEELDLYPDEEAEELALIFHARGVSMEEARKLGSALVQDPQKALDTLAREELGLNPEDLGSPWGAAVFSFVAFALGGVVPLLPFGLGGGPHAVPLAALLASIGLFSVGTALSLFTGRQPLWSGLRMVIIGAVAGITTYAIGSLLGVTLS